jgi:hypothetical protein
LEGASLIKNPCQVAEKLGRIRLEGDCTLIGARSGLEVPQPFLRLAEILVGLGRVGAKLHDTP